jgi:hypothetical protein
MLWENIFLLPTPYILEFGQDTENTAFQHYATWFTWTDSG